MRHGAYAILEEIRQVESHDVPLGVTLEKCAFCNKQIEAHEDHAVFQQTKDGKSYMAHRACQTENLTRIVRAMGKFGPGRIGAALRLDR